jgi:hypothetical protein
MTIQWPAAFFLAWGLYVLATSLCGPEGYRRKYRSGAVAALIGSKGARIVFIALGLLILTFGALVFFTVIDANDDVIKIRF